MPSFCRTGCAGPGSWRWLCIAGGCRSAVCVCMSFGSRRASCEQTCQFRSFKSMASLCLLLASIVRACSRVVGQDGRRRAKQCVSTHSNKITLWARTVPKTIYLVVDKWPVRGEAHSMCLLLPVNCR